jgi:hypothetical protein
MGLGVSARAAKLPCSVFTRFYVIIILLLVAVLWRKSDTFAAYLLYTYALGIYIYIYIMDDAAAESRRCVIINAKRCSGGGMLLLRVRALL